MNHRPPQSLQPNLSRMLRRAHRALGEGELNKAERLYAELLQHQPDNFDALHGLGQINYQRGRLDAALALTQEALKCDLSRVDGFASLGLVFHALRDFQRALASYDEGLRLAPDDAELRNLRGVVLLELGRAREALKSFDRVLLHTPNHIEALGNRGNALLKLNRVADALAAYDRALECAPRNVQLLTNRAAALRRLDRPGEAARSASLALAIKPDFAQARFVESLARLTLGDFAAGWRGYEARWQVGWLAAQRRSFAAPLWLGEESLDRKTILLHAEQGLGDTIQFARYATLLASRGANVILEVQRPLVRLLSRLRGVAAQPAIGLRHHAGDDTSGPPLYSASRRGRFVLASALAAAAASRRLGLVRRTLARQRSQPLHAAGNPRAFAGFARRRICELATRSTPGRFAVPAKS
jgi:tetratricopeptide (TPR) repeat protein